MHYVPLFRALRSLSRSLKLTVSNTKLKFHLSILLMRQLVLLINQEVYPRTDMYITITCNNVLSSGGKQPNVQVSTFWPFSWVTSIAVKHLLSGLATHVELT